MDEIETHEIDDIAKDLKNKNINPDAEFNYNGSHVEIYYDGEGIPTFRVDDQVVHADVIVKRSASHMDKNIEFWIENIKNWLDK